MRVSQSLLKDYRDYSKSLYCGILFKAIHIDRTTKKEPSEAMLKGQLFEYLATGSPIRDAKPDMLGQYFCDGLMAAGMKGIDFWDDILSRPIDFDNFQEDDWALVNKHWSSGWRSIFTQARLYQKTREHYGITHQELQYKIAHEEDDITWVIVIDILGPMVKYFHKDSGEQALDLAMIDTKLTGQYDKTFGDYAWGGSPDKLIFKDKLIVQPIFYQLVWRKAFPDQDPPPFFFFVHSASNEIDRKIIEINVGPTSMQDLEEEVKEMVTAIDFNNDFGWLPHPEVRRCHDCPLKKDCEHRADHPRIQRMTIL